MVAKSSAESELYGVVRGACEGLGVKTLCADLGSDIDIKLELDASAAKGILERQGIAKVRRIDVNCLWLQEQCSVELLLVYRSWLCRKFMIFECLYLINPSGFGMKG